MELSLDSKQRILKINKKKGLSYILNEAYKILGNPIFVFNMEYELIAHSDGYDNDDCICAEFVKYGKLSTETIEFLKNEDFIDAVANCHGTVYLTSEKLKYERIFGQLYSDKLSPVADLVIVACEKPFCEQSGELVAVLCALISSELAHDMLYKEYARDYQERIVGLLAGGKIEQREIYSGHVANIYNTLRDTIYVAVADISRSDSAVELSVCRDVLTRRCPDFRYYVYDNTIIMLLSFEGKEFSLEHEQIKKLSRLLRELNLRIGVSNSFENLFQMEIPYKQARQAVQTANQDCTNRRIFRYKNPKEL